MKLGDKLVQGVIFDLDGTLLDSCNIWIEVDHAFFKKRGLVLPDDYSKSIAHLGLDNAAKYTIERFHLDESKDAIIQEWKNMVLDEYKHKVKLKPGAREFLDYLKNNNVLICAATANDEDCYKTCLINNSIYDYFNFVLDVKGYPLGKDSPDIYIDAAKKLGVDISSCFVFEDILKGLTTAHNAGFNTVAIYEATCQDEKAKKQIADIYINDFNDLLKG